jgi:hypothetical protein
MVRILLVMLELLGLNLSLDTGYLIHRSYLTLYETFLLVNNQLQTKHQYHIQPRHKKITFHNKMNLILYFWNIVNIYKNL